MDRKYTYYGPMSAVTLAADVDHPNGRNVQLMRGLVVSLPEDNDYVKSLVARKYLVPVEDKAASTAKSTASQTAGTVKTAASTGTSATEAKTSTSTGTAASTATSQTTATTAATSTSATASTAKTSIAGSETTTGA